ncbi:MAG: hypothetical protein M1825_004059 [Sarcosagium campestre]|nr:MAG: hypothetical protein M1825_004059 [Sarcosagium campestre]
MEGMTDSLEGGSQGNPAPPQHPVEKAPEEGDRIPNAGDSSEGAAAAEGDGPKIAKRQVLSCTMCRKRKVKCDRVQPCRACCVRGHAKDCVFLIAEDQDYEPIRQVYEIAELRRENIRLKQQMRMRRFAGNYDYDEHDDGHQPGSGHVNLTVGGRRNPPKVPQKPHKLQQKRFKTSDPLDSMYFGAPGLADVISEFAKLQIRSDHVGSLTHAAPRAVDIFAFQDAPVYPFPALWPASGGTSALLACLPPDEELFGYLESFQKRAQSCSFPHVPDEITKVEIERFLSDREGNSFKHPDMLALIFAALAQGLQNGVYDKCGGEWVKGGMAAEAWKGDLYVSASMQALRIASFLNRPTLLAIETLIMICPYLTNSGKFLDAWALLGLTIRLSQSIGLHRNPKFLNPAPPLRECGIRQALWWWLLHMDQQYCMTLGRPLGISGIGDCPPPVPLSTDAVALRLSEYVNNFTILARQILSSERLTRERIDDYTDKLLDLQLTLPDVIKFDETWLDPDRKIPPWPLDAMAAVFHGKTHNFLILLNRQRLEIDSPALIQDSPPSLLTSRGTAKPYVRGRERVLASARTLLHCFEFFQTRVRAAMICWTMGQQAFNAAMILTLNLLHPQPGASWASNAISADPDKDRMAIEQAYVTFREMEIKGIHKLAGVACAKLSPLILQLDRVASRRGSAPNHLSNTIGPSDTTIGLSDSTMTVPEAQGPGHGVDSSVNTSAADALNDGAEAYGNEDVIMGNNGMILLEDPGLQSFVGETYAPLNFQMAGNDLNEAGYATTNAPAVKDSSFSFDSSSSSRSPAPSSRRNMNMNMASLVAGGGGGIGSPAWAARPAPAFDRWAMHSQPQPQSHSHSHSQFQYQSQPQPHSQSQSQSQTQSQSDPLHLQHPLPPPHPPQPQPSQPSMTASTASAVPTASTASTAVLDYSTFPQPFRRRAPPPPVGQDSAASVNVVKNLSSAAVSGA